MQVVVEGHGASRRREGAGEVTEGYVKEYTRHSNDVLLNLNELRHRDILTDATLLVGSARLQAHCAVLVACSGYFYTLVVQRGYGPGAGPSPASFCLPSSLDVSSVSLLLDFMYTSRLPLSPSTVAGVLATATYLQMDHVADTCRTFMLNSPEKPHTISSSERIPAAVPPLLELSSPPTSVFRAPPGGVPLKHRLSSSSAGTSSPLPLPTNTPPTAAKEAESPNPATSPGEQQAMIKQGACLSPEPRSQGMSEPVTPSPNSPLCSNGQPNSPAGSSSCSLSPKTRRAADAKPLYDPKACNWKKYKYIVLNPLCSTSIKEEDETGAVQQEGRPSPSLTNDVDSTPKGANEEWPKHEQEMIDRVGNPSFEVVPCSTSNRLPLTGFLSALDPVIDHMTILPPVQNSPYLLPCQSDSEMADLTGSPTSRQLSMKRESHYSLLCYPGNMGANKLSSTGEKPYHCHVCGAQFNRPANLKTHSRIHSGEKPYHCDTCGARFVQVAHLRAHVLIHTGEKPYPCHTCGTRFRHLQTLKSHLRIHTGEKPYRCEKCDVHFRHKSQLRLHLRQKHGAITNTKVRYKLLSGGAGVISSDYPYHTTSTSTSTALQAC